MYLIDPLKDSRWSRLVEQHPAACSFHTVGWLRALADTYGYSPVAITSSSPDSEHLSDGLPFCHVKSIFTGNRVVSLPFSDHCDPIGCTTHFEFATEHLRSRDEKFVEFRPLSQVPQSTGPAQASSTFWRHWLDLSPSIEKIFSGLHKDSVQRKIRRAEREGLRYEESRSAEILSKFYGLLLRTRRRHGIPPQPIQWFRNLLECMGECITVRMALKDSVPVASILSLKHRNSVIYKYGCSDDRYHAMGGMPFLFWRLIEDAKSQGIPVLDFGRSDLDNAGLIRFKDQWGTQKAGLTYYRLPLAEPRRAGKLTFARATAKQIIAHLPDSMLQITGKLLYRHIG
jgi:hypothetical protein